MFDDDTPLEVLVERERTLNLEYGPCSPAFWFMFDNHTFKQLTGTADEMAAQARRCFDRDECGSVFVRLAPNGQEVRALSFHGDWQNPHNTRDRLARWANDVRLITGE